MFEFMYMLFHNRRFVIVGFIIVADLILMSMLATTAQSKHVSAAPKSNVIATPAHSYDSPNIITNAFLRVNDSIGNAVNSINGTLYDGVATIGGGAAQVGSEVSQGAHSVASVATHGVKGGFGTVGHVIGSSFVFFGRTVIGGSLVFIGRDVIVGSYVAEWHALESSAAFTGNTIGSAFGLVTHVTNVASFIKPAESDKQQVPVIDEGYSTIPLAQATKAPLKTVSKSAPKVDVKPQWPIHGAITTLFGVPELPYEAIHTGLDIADATAPGTTPIRPFKPGRVIQVIHSSLGLGNHVVVDHGSGMTSVYGHMNSTAVSVGQWVDEKTVLGYEGETGVATGVHLHFEIRINGTAVNPLNYIPGRP